MSVKMKFGSKDIPFVYKGDKLVYPNPIKDGLLLWYDFKGMRNTDTNKEVAKDLSLNGNDGTLTNFNFTEGSGYKDNTLVFDGVDDSLTIPKLELDETAMSVMYDDKIYSYEDDKVITVNKYSDGASAELDGLEVGGRNLIRNSNAVSEWGGGAKSGEIGGYEAIHIDKTSGDSFWANISSSNFDSDRQSDELLTLSGWFYIDGDVEFSTLARTIVRFDNPDKASYWDRLVIRLNELERDKWVYAHTTQIVSGGYTQIRHIGFSIPEGSVYFRDLKLEKGNVPTTWTPAPEDFQATSLSPSSISNLQLYNRPLRKDELLHNAESGGLKELVDGAVVQDGLVLHYDFSHESNISEFKDKAFDYSGNGNHGELQNFNYTEESGYAEDGLKFDGVDDGIVTPNVTLIDSVTIQTTLSIYSGTPYAPIFRIHVGRGVFFLGFNNIANGGVLWFGTNGDEGIVQHMSIHTLPINKKLVLTLVYNGEKSTVEVFVNGEKVAEGQHDIIPLNYIGRLFIGRQGDVPDRVMKADYNSLLYYNRALTPEEITHNHQIEKEKFNII